VSSVHGYVIGPADQCLSGIADIYRQVGFRSDLIDDLFWLRDFNGAAVFTATLDGKTVGASSCLSFGERTGWVGGVAVDPLHRHHGLGRRLTGMAVDELKRRGIGTVLLHATQAAEPLYWRMGFKVESVFSEWTGTAPAGLVPEPKVRPATQADLDWAAEFDFRVTGEDRSALLARLWPHGAHVYDDGAIQGFHLPQVATAVGAILAEHGSAGIALLRTALALRSGRIRVPVPVQHTDITDLLGSLQFSETARTTRMWLGSAVSTDHTFLFSAFNLYWG
jgi:GNAT superfamily N-acetyltransferase